MFGLMMMSDSISKTERRKEVVRGLQELPGKIEAVLALDDRVKAYAQVRRLLLSLATSQHYHTGASEGE